MIEEDSAYLARREAQARKLAATALEPLVRKKHLEMAEAYAARKFAILGSQADRSNSDGDQ